MAESSGEKTEMPTPKKLRDARQKGQVCTSKDIVSTALLLVLFAVLAWMGGALLTESQQLLGVIGARLADPGNGAVQACGALTILLIFKYSFIFVLVAAVVGIVANNLLYKIIWASVPELLQMCYGTVDDIMPSLRVMLKRLAVYTVAGYVLIAIVDRIFQGRNFTKEMMMTKDEVKREYKEMEGSQEVKQAQREFRNELLNGPDPVKATKEAKTAKKKK